MARMEQVNGIGQFGFGLPVTVGNTLTGDFGQLGSGGNGYAGLSPVALVELIRAVLRSAAQLQANWGAALGQPLLPGYQPVGAAAGQPLGVAPAQPGQALGRELDAGKSTQTGDTDYFEGKSVITDADTAVEIGDILVKRGKSDIKVDDMANELRDRGYSVEVTSVDGKKAIRFQNGDLFVDSSGDGQLGSEDVKFNESLSKIEQKHGINLTQMKSTLDLMAAQRKAEKAAKKMGLAGAGMYGLLGPGQAAPGEAGRPAYDFEATVKEALESLGPQMAAAGYQGQESPFELWKKGTLTPELARLNLTGPNLPMLEDRAMQAAVCQCCLMFNAAFQVAGLLGRTPYAAA